MSNSFFCTVCICCLLAVATAPQEKVGSPQDSGRITGTFVDSSDAPLGSIEVFLSRVLVLEADSEGKYHHARRLPPKGSFVVGALEDDKPIPVKADAQGRFGFSRVSPGRYSLCVRRQGRPGPAKGEYQSLYNPAGVVVFDLAAGQTIDVGKVSTKKE